MLLVSVWRKGHALKSGEPVYVQVAESYAVDCLDGGPVLLTKADGTTKYAVGPFQCTCPDFGLGNGDPCEHITACVKEGLLHARPRP